MNKRWLRMLACVGLLVSCDVYNPPESDSSTSGTGGDDGSSGTGGNPDGPCVPSEEVCNDKDDDCNGTIDDEEPASADCSRRYHATVSCRRGGFCLFSSSNPMCHPGWYHCDGMPQTGCESDMPCCPTCAADSGLDGSMDDSGADDAGSL